MLGGGISVTSITSAYAGQTPDLCAAAFQQVVERARALLVNRDIREINDEFETLEWMVVHLDPARFGAVFRDSSGNVIDEPAVTERSLAVLLFAERDTYQLDRPSQFTWPEYFGLLALWMIEDARFKEIFFTGMDLPEEHRALIPGTIAMCSVDAMEAVFFGEYLAREQRAGTLDQTLKKRISLNAQQAAIQRHAATAKLKEEFIAYYAKNNHLSRRQAADKFYHSLPEDQRPRLQDHVRVLTDALRRYERATLITGIKAND